MGGAARVWWRWSLRGWSLAKPISGWISWARLARERRRWRHPGDAVGQVAWISAAARPRSPLWLPSLSRLRSRVVGAGSGRHHGIVGQGAIPRAGGSRSGAGAGDPQLAVWVRWCLARAQPACLEGTGGVKRVGSRFRQDGRAKLRRDRDAGEVVGQPSSSSTSTCGLALGSGLSSTQSSSTSGRAQRARRWAALRASVSAVNHADESPQPLDQRGVRDAPRLKPFEPAGSRRGSRRRGQRTERGARRVQRLRRAASTAGR